MGIQGSALKGARSLFGEKGMGIGGLLAGKKDLLRHFGTSLTGRGAVRDVMALQKGVGTWATGAGALTMGAGLLGAGDENRGWMGVGAQVGAGYAMLRGGMGLRRGFGGMSKGLAGGSRTGVTNAMKRTTTRRTGWQMPSTRQEYYEGAFAMLGGSPSVAGPTKMQAIKSHPVSMYGI